MFSHTLSLSHTRQNKKYKYKSLFLSLSLSLLLLPPLSFISLLRYPSTKPNQNTNLSLSPPPPPPPPLFFSDTHPLNPPLNSSNHHHHHHMLRPPIPLDHVYINPPIKTNIQTSKIIIITNGNRIFFFQISRNN